MPGTSIPCRISTVTPCGRYGTIELPQHIDGLRYAVIHDETQGLAMVYTRLGGKLRVGAQVVITGLQRSPEAFRVGSIA